MIYLDHAATTPVLPAALEAAWPFLTSDFGNPSSSHELGQRAASALEDARSRVARTLGARASEVVFTSGGSESNNTAITGIALANPRGRHIVSARTEHESVLESVAFLERVHGFEVSWLPVSRTGEIDLDDVQSALRDDTTLVTLMLANNEIGAVHPIAEIASLGHAVGARVHTDAVQAAGWGGVSLRELGVDALTLSGHKFGAPKGVGILLITNGVACEPLIHGGGQEHELRSGTENVAWAVAASTALEHATSGAITPELAELLIAGIRREVPSAVLTGPEHSAAARHAGICSFIFPGVNGETLLLELETRGVLVSSGAACAAGRDEPSHVLLACGFTEDEARTAVRFSLGRSTTRDDILTAIAATAQAHQTVAQLGR